MPNPIKNTCHCYCHRGHKGLCQCNCSQEIKKEHRPTCSIYLMPEPGVCDCDMQYNPIQHQNSYRSTKNECCEKCIRTMKVLDQFNSEPVKKSEVFTCSNYFCSCHHPVKEDKKPSQRIAEITLENLRKQWEAVGNAAFSFSRKDGTIDAIIQYLDEQHGK